MNRIRKTTATIPRAKSTEVDESIGETPPRTEPVTIEPLKMREIRLHIVGESPLIFNRLSEKAKRDLLLPPAPKNRAAKRETLKHNPLQEFRDSLHTQAGDDVETRLMLPSTAFKGGSMTAALEIPGVFKTSVGRLIQVSGWLLPIWGIPQMFMTGVRQAGINKTPDIRTRAICPEWASAFVVRYPVGAFDPSSVANLFAAAGQICGVGDFRQEKGKGSFGLFRLVNADDADFARICAAGGREAQDAAIANPGAFDAETAELWSWFEQEVIARGRGEEVAHA